MHAGAEAAAGTTNGSALSIDDCGPMDRAPKEADVRMAGVSYCFCLTSDVVVAMMADDVPSAFGHSNSGPITGH